MKTITFEGKQYEVEDWVNWVAMDSDGSVYGYEMEPHKEFFCYRIVGGRQELIVEIDRNWQDSLTKV